MSEQWSQDWSNAVFSLEERDRRWKKVRELMARDGIDVIACIPCTNFVTARCTDSDPDARRIGYRRALYRRRSRFS